MEVYDIFKFNYFSNAYRQQIYARCSFLYDVFDYLTCSGIIIFIAPIDTTAKPISIDEKKAYRSKIKVIILLHFCAFVWMLLKNEKAIMYVIDFSYITQTIMLFLEMTARRLSNTRIKN